MREGGRRPGIGPWLATAAAGTVAAMVGSYSCAGQEAYCGNGTVDPGEECDDGNQDNSDGCTRFCQRSVCGDGILNETSEQCDDRNTEPWDGCDETCQREGMVCGDGTLDDVGPWPEECDDGNSRDGDGCSANCFNELGDCGDGIRQYGEECDDGNTTSCDGCDDDCRIETTGCDADAGTDGDVVDGRDGEAVDGEAVDGEALDGEAADGEAIDGEAVDGEIGETTEADAADAEVEDTIVHPDGWDCTNPICDFAPQCGCESGTKCTLLGAGRGCGATGFLAEGRPCTSDSECAAGLYCAPAIGTDVLFCHRFCEVDTDCLGPGSKCVVPVVGGSPATTMATLCSVSCDLESGSGCPEGVQCTVFSESDGSWLTDCSGPVGSGRLGHSCAENSDCAAGFFCAAPSYPNCVQYCGYPDGYCDGGFVCQSFTPTVRIGTREYGYCG